METVLLDFNRIKILEEDQNEKVFQELLAMRKLWLQRNNWHPKVEIEGPDEEIEKYIHYYTLGSTLYMDARDRGWDTYAKLEICITRF